MVRAHQHGAGEGAEASTGRCAGEHASLSLALQGQQATLRLLLYVATEQETMPAIAYLHHATVVIATRPRPLGPEHAKIQPLPVPALTTATQGRAAGEAERRELAAHRHRLQHCLPIARMVPVLVTDDEGIEYPHIEPVQHGQDGGLRHVVTAGVAIPGVIEDAALAAGDEYRQALPHVQHPHLPGRGSRPGPQQQCGPHREQQTAPSRQVPGPPQQHQQGADGHQPAGNRPPELQMVRQQAESPQHPRQPQIGQPEQAVSQGGGDRRQQHADQRQRNDAETEQRQRQQIEQERQRGHALEQQQLQGQQPEQQQALQTHQSGARVQQARQQQQGHRHEGEPEAGRVEGEGIPEHEHHEGPQPDAVAGPVPLQPAQQAPHQHHDEGPLGRHRKTRQPTVDSGKQEGDQNGPPQPQQPPQPPAEHRHQGDMLAGDGDDVGQAAAAKQIPLGIRDAPLLPEAEGRQQGGLLQPLPGGAGSGQPALPHPGCRPLDLDETAQVAGRRDPLAKQQAPPIHACLVGQPVGGLERTHQGNATAGGQGRQCLVGIDPDESGHPEGLLVQRLDPQQQAGKFISWFIA